jgi:predicted ribosomally synthesized peptide with SipW-like signal peptide
MKKVLLSVVTILAVLAMVSGGVMAYFNDRETSSDNTFEAATVDFAIFRSESEATIDGPMFYTTSSGGENPTGLWMPGTSHTRQLKVDNVGTAQVKLKRLGAVASGDAEMIDALDVDIECPGSIFPTLYQGRLRDLLGQTGVAIPPSAWVFIDPGASITLDFTVTMRSGVGNDVQGKNAVVDFWLYGVQAFGIDLDPPLGLSKAEMHPVYSSGTYASVAGDIFYYQVADEFMGTISIENAVPDHSYMLGIEANPDNMPGAAQDYYDSGISYYDDSLNPPCWTTPGGIWHDASGVPGNTVELIDFFLFKTDAQGQYQGDFRSTTSPAGITYASGSMPPGEYTDVKFMVKDAEAWNIYSEYGSWCTQVLILYCIQDDR